MFLLIYLGFPGEAVVKNLLTRWWGFNTWVRKIPRVEFKVNLLLLFENCWYGLKTILNNCDEQRKPSHLWSLPYVDTRLSWVTPPTAKPLELVITLLARLSCPGTAGFGFLACCFWEDASPYSKSSQINFHLKNCNQHPLSYFSKKLPNILRLEYFLPLPITTLCASVKGHMLFHHYLGLANIYCSPPPNSTPWLHNFIPHWLCLWVPSSCFLSSLCNTCWVLYIKY